VPEILREQLTRSKIIITNFHTFLLREKVAVGKLTKQVLGNGGHPLSPKRPMKWFVASAVGSVPRRTSSSSMTKPTTVTAASRNRSR